MKNTNLTKDKLVDWLTENKATLENLEYEKGLHNGSFSF